jgi:hypothetical protein
MTRWSPSIGSGASIRAGRRLDRPVLGLYRIRDGWLARAQMFHFDTAAIIEFLAGADGPSQRGAV